MQREEREAKGFKKSVGCAGGGRAKTLSICQPAGSSVGTGAVSDWPLGFATTSSTATSEVKRVTR